jgi:surface protein
MNSLQELNTFGQTTLDVTDLRPAGVVFDRLFPLTPIDDVRNITTATVVPTPGMNVDEIINYSTANVRYRVTIVTGTADPLVGSTITFPTLPAHMSLSVVDNVYTVSGFKSADDWQAVKSFTWNLPSNYASYPLWYLDVAVLYYDAALDEERVVDWEVYDDDYYWISQMTVDSAQITIPTKIKQISADLSTTVTVFCDEGLVQNASAAFTCTTSASINGGYGNFAESTMSSTTAISADLRRLRRTTVSLTSAFTTVINPYAIRPAASNIAATSSLSASLTDAPFEFSLTPVTTSTFSIRRLSGSDITVDWGDGTTTVLSGTVVDQSPSRLYTSSSNRTVRIFGNVTKVNLGNTTGVNHQVNGVYRFNNNLQSFSMQHSFTFGSWQESAFTFAPTIIPNTLTDLSYAFYDCPSFNQDISGWNTENITNMSNMFALGFGTSSFNQNIGSWNTGNVTNMTAMFRGATSFDQDLSGWCVSLIPTKPTNFDQRTSANWTTAEKPVWGTCP